MNVNDEIKKRKEEGLFRERKTINSPQGAQVVIGDKKFLNFSSNDYLGLANNNKLKLHMVESIKKYGVGSGSSQLMTGHMRPHQLLEKRLSIFLVYIVSI